MSPYLNYAGYGKFVILVIVQIISFGNKQNQNT